MDRRQWLRRLVAAGVAAGPTASPAFGQAMAGSQAWLHAALPALPAEPRRLRAYDLRIKAAVAAASVRAPHRDANADEREVPAYLAMFSKGLPHDGFGIVDPEAYRTLARAAAAHPETTFEDVPMGGARRLVSPQAAFMFALEGLDAALLASAPPPRHGSVAFALDAIDACWLALLRDVPFAAYGDDPLVRRAARDLAPPDAALEGGDVLQRGSRQLPGPVVSQFLLRAVPMGAQMLSPHVPAQVAGEHFLGTWDEWLASQNGALPRRDVTVAGRRYICCGRDLATWTRTDYPGQAGVQAALLLEALRAPVSADHPYVHSRNQAGYVTFGLPFIVDLASRIAMHALRAAWFHKWAVYRRLRPEELGGRLEAAAAGAPVAAWPDRRLLHSDGFTELRRRTGSCLLPMAWPEGAPLHPSYPAAHAATAGAMVTVLKAYYAADWIWPDPVEATADGRGVRRIDVGLAVGDELDKLAWNIALGRVFAGVQWRSDAEAGLAIGEAVAIGVLRELQEVLPERNTHFAVRRFDGTAQTL